MEKLISRCLVAAANRDTYGDNGLTTQSALSLRKFVLVCSFYVLVIYLIRPVFSTIGAYFAM